MAGTIIEFIVLLVTHAAAGIYSSTLRYSKKVTYIIWGTLVAIQAVFLLYTEFVLTSLVLQFFVGFILSLIGQYIIFFATTKGKVAQRIFTMLTYSVFFCIAMSFIATLKGSFNDMHWIVNALIHAFTLLVIIIYFLRYVCPLCRTASKNITTGWLPMIFVDIVFLITIILSSIFPVRLTSFTDSAFIPFIFLSISIMSVYPVIFSSINHMSEAADKREVETQNKLLIAQIEAETLQLDADSQARHDRRHHNLIMLEFANNNDIESIKKYLSSLVERDSSFCGEVRYCDNLTVNTILTVYGRKAKENDISVNIKASVSRDLSIAPQDLVIVIANVFDNAINAVSKIKGRERYIDITIKDNLQRLIVMVSNPCNENMIFDELYYGIGIRSVISTVNKYEGMYDFSANEGLFSAKINMNL